MAIPEQVRRAGERANQLIEQANGLKPEVPPAEPTPVEPTPETVPQPEDPTPKPDQPQEPSSDTPAAPSEQPPEPTPEPAPTATPPKQDFEHKYKTLQGVFNAESGRWQAEKKAMEAENKALRDQLTQRPAEPTPAPTPPKPVVSEQDIETYGPELIDLIGRKASEMAEQIVAAKVAALQPELEKLNANVTDVATQGRKTAQEQFLDALAREVPDWQTTNADERWLEWLNQVDPLSGVPRQKYLDHAAQQLDVAHTVRLFKAFKDSVGEGTSPTPAADTPAPAQTKPPVSPTPRTVGNATAPNPKQPDTTVSRAEIDAHYRRGSTDPRYRTSPEHEAMEKRISVAMASGAITG